MTTYLFVKIYSEFPPKFGGGLKFESDLRGIGSAPVE